MIQRGRKFIYGMPDNILEITDALNAFGFMPVCGDGFVKAKKFGNFNDHWLIEDTEKFWRLIPCVYLNSKKPRYDFDNVIEIPK